MSKNLFLLLAILFALLSICLSRPSPWYRSEPSAETKKKANENYRNDPLQHWVCSHFGDDSPKIRDDLIKRKDNGEGFVERHWNAWSNSENYEKDNRKSSNEKVEKREIDRTVFDNSFFQNLFKRYKYNLV